MSFTEIHKEEHIFLFKRSENIQCVNASNIHVYGAVDMELKFRNVDDSHTVIGKT